MSQEGSPSSTHPAIQWAKEEEKESARLPQPLSAVLELPAPQPVPKTRSFFTIDSFTQFSQTYSKPKPLQELKRTISNNTVANGEGTLERRVPVTDRNEPGPEEVVPGASSDNTATSLSYSVPHASLGGDGDISLLEQQLRGRVEAYKTAMATVNAYPPAKIAYDSDSDLPTTRIVSELKPDSPKLPLDDIRSPKKAGRQKTTATVANETKTRASAKTSPQKTKIQQPRPQTRAQRESTTIPKLNPPSNAAFMQTKLIKEKQPKAFVRPLASKQATETPIPKFPTPDAAHPVHTQDFHFSSLNAQEHKRYWSVSQRLIAQGKTRSDLTADERVLFEKADKEQEGWRRHQRLKALAHPERYWVYPQMVASFTNNIIRQKINRIHRYPRYYVRRPEVIDMKSIQSDEIRFSGPSLVLNMGKVLHFTALEEGEQIHNLKYYSFEDEDPDEDDIMLGPSYRKFIKQEVADISNDPFIARIVDTSRDKIDVCVSSSTLSTLADYHGSCQWDIPVVVKKDEKGRKVVLVDKPFIKKKLTLRQLNELFYNIAVKHLALNRVSLEPSVPLPTLHNRFKAGEFGTPTDEKFLGRNSDNMTYSTYMLSDMKILVRCRIHGYVLETQKREHTLGSTLLQSDAHRRRRYIGSRIKLDYRADVEGPEQFTPSEKTEWWFYTFFRPDAHLRLTRIHPASQRTQEYGLEQLVEPDEEYLILASHKNIHTIFQHLTTLEEGSYLISSDDDRVVTTFQNGETPTTKNMFPPKQNDSQIRAGASEGGEEGGEEGGAGSVGEEGKGGEGGEAKGDGEQQAQALHKTDEDKTTTTEQPANLDDLPTPDQTHHKTDTTVEPMNLADPSEPVQTIISSPPSFLLDLHAAAQGYGQIDRETVPYVPTYYNWADPHVLPPNQIPETSHPCPPRQPPLSYCFSFRDQGYCTRKECIFPHYTLAEIQEIERRLASSKAEEKAKRSKRNKKNKKRKRAEAGNSERAEKKTRRDPDEDGEGPRARLTDDTYEQALAEFAADLI